MKPIDGYNRHQIHHPPIFMPILCSRSSIKDVRLPKWQRKSSQTDPNSSPKVGCMGQVKRSNRVIGFPIPYLLSSSSSSIASNVKYEKLKRIFSGKSVPNGERKVQSARETIHNVKIGRNCAPAAAPPVNVCEMDPPLPVVILKKEEIGSEEDVSLWKRRSGGIALKSLVVQQQVNPNSLSFQPRTV
ncbi:uncharacterized protein LOC124927977 [Impatiens glandulifera]|uniref:uncharacterized protein LOC124927977 n=1 Tax=Impatiens glandulifera TaxID=253017 RepID=UPI001FB13597|nr:uncharacterized protein LOC124927977 [Impatiens glandulifera]